MRVERATPSDLVEISELWHRSWLSSDPQDRAAATVSDLRNRLQCENWDLHLVREDGRIVAFLALDERSDILAQMLVEPACQRRRIGHFLLGYAKRRMPGGFTLRTDETNTGARRFYEKNGLILDRCEDRRAYYRWHPDR
jgi:GNAT superfamily N-acetyltransferase